MSTDGIILLTWLGVGLVAGVAVTAYLMAVDADREPDNPYDDSAPPAVIGFFAIFLWPLGVIAGVVVAVGAAIHYTARGLVRRRVTAAERQRHIDEMERDLGIGDRP